jgi:leucyl aminopeptidase
MKRLCAVAWTVICAASACALDESDEVQQLARALATSGEAPVPVEPRTVWITMEERYLATVNAVLDEELQAGPVRPLAKRGPLVAAAVPEPALALLSRVMHEHRGGCGGFLTHDSADQARAALVPQPAAEEPPQHGIRHQQQVKALSAEVDENQIVATILALSQFATRYYDTESGLAAPRWIHERWQEHAAGRGDITVQLLDHANFDQQSVMLTIPGSTTPGEVVILGGHLDSRGSWGGSGNRAPGADDDASGIATLTEILRLLIAGDFRPERTVIFIGYAAEEVGLRGSQELAARFRRERQQVVGVMQLDMTNYQGSAEDIVLMRDNTSASLSEFVTRLIDTYVGVRWSYDQCGYACSDHASWHRQRFPAVMPFEARMGQYNPHIHSAGDTLEVSDGRAVHALKFARLGLAFAVELGRAGQP